ncbi:uncharacterized protein G2W53_037542 [Senna tora]|uniref:Uncharacterized protein n=1 Tax=Senna tora TaxID=362788 RepID=A0A834SKM4_9FABA|nr:uncharacterized protein G2W53_037542 [Senna tora]
MRLREYEICTVTELEAFQFVLLILLLMIKDEDRREANPLKKIRTQKGFGSENGRKFKVVYYGERQEDVRCSVAKYGEKKNYGRNVHKVE